MGSKRRSEPWPEVPGVTVPDDVAEQLLKWQRWRNSLPVHSTEQLSLWHTSCNHRNYNLSCEQFEELLAECQFRCQVCGRKNVKLHIDHDHAVGWWGVRGLLCQTCNSRLGHIELGRTPTDERFERFLANPYPGRREPVVIPVFPLKRLLEAELQTHFRADAKKDGFRQGPTADLMSAAAERRTKKFRKWAAEWETREYPRRLLRLWDEVESAHGADGPLRF